MLRNRRGDAEGDERYWARRIRSPAFRRDLEGVIGRDLDALSHERIEDVIDRDVVERVIQEWDSKIVNEQLVADLVIAASGRVATQLKKRRASLRATIDPQLAADLEALLQQRAGLSRRAEDLIAAIMRQEFVRRLFGDIIFTSIVAFHEKANPLFGGIAVRLMQEQIKGFIDLFMPMLQKQAIAFAITKENQRVLLSFVRAIIRHLLDAPLADYAEMASSWQKKKVSALIRTAFADAARSEKLEQLVREMALAVGTASTGTSGTRGSATSCAWRDMWGGWRSAVWRRSCRSSRVPRWCSSWPLNSRSRPPQSSGRGAT